MKSIGFCCVTRFWVNLLPCRRVQKASVLHWLREPKSFQPQYNTNVEYGLSPEILLVCSQICLEASAVSYECNTFCLSCEYPVYDNNLDFENHKYSINTYKRALEICPLNQKTVNQPLLGYDGALTDVPAVQRVRRWRISTPMFKPDTQNQVQDRWGLDKYLWGTNKTSIPVEVPWGLTSFSWAIGQTPLLSLKIIIYTPEFVSTQRKPSRDIYNPAEYLRPLKWLKSVNSIKFRAVEAFGSYSQLPTWVPDGPEFPGPDVRQELRSLVTSKSPIEPLFQMYHQLLSYALTFERYAPFKTDMATPGTPYCDDVHRKWSPFKPYRIQNWQDNPDQLLEFQTDLAKPGTQHPVEEAICNAKVSVVEGDYSGFKYYRRVILEYLKRQYRRIAKASDEIINFIKF
ncbi:hypothetical protein B0J14DRAFT_274538 [Halenospora varia]|nr:hypothetical protein B0J14DRAFT_274538 [Halenospora varia]